MIHGFQSLVSMAGWMLFGAILLVVIFGDFVVLAITVLSGVH
jgi:hypothetical protein